MKSVCISLLTYNNHEQTRQCLQSLEKLELHDISLSVVVVDNASKEKFDAGQKEFNHFGLHIIYSEKNTGFSGGNNQAIQYGLDHGADYIMVLNNDTTVDKQLLTVLIDSLEERKDAGAVVPKIYFSPGHEFHTDRYSKDDLGKVIWYAGGEIDWNNVYGKHIGVDEVDHGQFDTQEKTELLTGCCVLFRADVFEKVGLFNEEYFLYFEDADLSMRLKIAGFTSYYIPEAKLWHLNAGSTGGSGSALQDYFLSRNRLLFGFTYAPLKTQFALFRESVRLLLTGREWQRKGLTDFFLKRFGKGSYPV